ncbi:MAG: hypothetical protein HY855_03420 [Burkholderiales bacterium]|nr:hypothetical protein [Burkholderiales bacterium]
MAKAWSTFLPDVLPSVQGCPVLVAEQRLRRASQLFFEKSRAWSVRTALMAVAADQSDVTVTLPDSQTELVRVEAAWLDGRKLTPATARELDDSCEDWTELVGTPSHVVQLTPGVVRLFRIPTAAATEGLRLRASVRPSETATGIPDDLAVKYRDALIKGAIGLLLMIPKRPWTDMELGQGMLTSFEADAAAAASSANSRGHSTGRRAAAVNWC